MSIRREDPVTVLKGIGQTRAEHLRSAGIETVGDLTDYYPSRYEIYEKPGPVPENADGQVVAVCGFFERAPAVRKGGRGSITMATVRLRPESGTNPSGGLQALWFNMPYLRSSVKTGTLYVLRGRLRRSGRGMSLLQPQLYAPEEYEAYCTALQPVYPQVKGLTNQALRKSIRQALEALEGAWEDDLPPAVRERYALEEPAKAAWQMHFPQNEAAMQRARNRLVFEEFLLFLLTVRMLRETVKQATRLQRLHPVEEEALLLQALPYRLTGAQQRAWEQMKGELTGEGVMARLLQGDVGCGKTVVAFLALLTAAGNGTQGALMVPTEVLARQHYDSFARLCEKAGIDCPVVLLTGSMTAKEKRQARMAAACGEARVLIGTHALIQEGVSFANLTVVVTDEQHRFGVRQRELLYEKGELPHTLVMSATPIPRTLAAILFGDLDVTTIDELPGGRLPVKNCLVGKSWRPNAWRFIRREIEAGHQAYVICPLVDGSEMVDAENVTEYAGMLQKELGGDICVGMLHGRMKNAQKNDVMEAFAQRRIQVLVSTTVVEVGVNVPNATVMMIENAERFGLAQLHQLRGRVGRGDAQSYCIFLCADASEETHSRLEILEQSNDGFEVARRDLGMRGPGDLLGVRQSGEAQFRVADIYRDAEILKAAAQAAEELYEAVYRNSEMEEMEEMEYEGIRKKLRAYQEDKRKNLNL